MHCMCVSVRAYVRVNVHAIEDRFIYLCYFLYLDLFVCSEKHRIAVATRVLKHKRIYTDTDTLTFPDFLFYIKMIVS